MKISKKFTGIAIFFALFICYLGYGVVLHIKGDLSMEILFFRIGWILVLFCIGFGIFLLVKKKWFLGIANIWSPIFMLVYYGATDMIVAEPITELQRFEMRLSSGMMEAKITVILYFCFLFVFAMDVCFIIFSKIKKSQKYGRRYRQDI